MHTTCLRASHFKHLNLFAVSPMFARDGSRTSLDVLKSNSSKQSILKPWNSKTLNPKTLYKPENPKSWKPKLKIAYFLDVLLGHGRSWGLEGTRLFWLEISPRSYPLLAVVPTVPSQNSAWTQHASRMQSEAIDMFQSGLHCGSAPSILAFLLSVM